MKNVTIIFLSVVLLSLFLKCSSDTDSKTKEKENFELVVYEEPEEEIKEFKVANVIPYFDNGKWGYANKKGEIVIPCKYNSCSFFSDGMALVEKDLKFGFIDTTGKLVIDYQYMEAHNFKQGIAIVKHNKYKGVIDKNNNVLIPFEYEDLQINDDKFICFKQNNQWGLMTTEGYQLINPIYDDPFFFENGFAIVQRNRKYGIVNIAGDEVILCKYEKVSPTRNSNFIVMIEPTYNEKLYGVVDSTGRTIFPITNKEIQEVINNNFIIKSDGGTAIFNHKKDTIIDFKFSGIRAGNTNLLAATSTGQWGFINLKGDTIIPFKFWDAQGFFNNYAIVKNGGYGMINTKGEITVPFEFDKIVYADKKIVRVYKNEKYGFYSLEGKKLTECIYDDIDYSLDGNERFMRDQGNLDNELVFGEFINAYAVVGINGRMGAINKNGQEVIKPYYHKLSPFDKNGIAKASYMYRSKLINSAGKTITNIGYESISRDEESGYYFLCLRAENENKGQNRNFGYFNLDGTFYSNAKNGTVEVESDEDIILAIRKEYQNIINNLKTAKKGNSSKIDEDITATLRANRMIVTNKDKQLSYEYYYNEKLNNPGPFFILKTDKSSGKPKHDRFYYKDSKIIRWIDQSGEHRAVANGPYAPEHEELFKARFFFAAHANQLIIRNSTHNQEIEKIKKLVEEINEAISQGKYKKGDVYESWEGSGGGGHEEYLEDEGRTIYRHEHDGSDYSGGSSKKYFKQGKLIYSSGEYSSSVNLMGAGNYASDEISESSSETFFFSDGSKREYLKEWADGGYILFITEQ